MPLNSHGHEMIKVSLSLMWFTLIHFNVKIEHHDDNIHVQIQVIFL